MNTNASAWQRANSRQHDAVPRDQTPDEDWFDNLPTVPLRSLPEHSAPTKPYPTQKQRTATSSAGEGYDEPPYLSKRQKKAPEPAIPEPADWPEDEEWQQPRTKGQIVGQWLARMAKATFWWLWHAKVFLAAAFLVVFVATTYFDYVGIRDTYQMQRDRWKYRSVIDDDRRTGLKPSTVCELAELPRWKCDIFVTRLERPNIGGQPDPFTLHFVGLPMSKGSTQFECTTLRVPPEVSIEDGVQTWIAETAHGQGTPCLSDFIVSVRPAYIPIPASSAPPNTATPAVANPGKP